MLRIGKNAKEQEEQEHSSDKQEVSYPAPKNYSSYQGTSEAKPATETPSGTGKAMTESENLAREIKEGTLSGFVGGGTLVTGEATFKAMLRVDGHLSGKVTSSSGTLIVGANGIVDANIEVAIAVIHGTINGDIIATQRLELGRAAKVNGNIQTPSLMIEQGAVFEGTCKMVQMNADKNKKEQKESQSFESPKAAPADVAPKHDVTKPTPQVSNVSRIAT
jgi:cytoskeletal protein CcmA (bactofilin family)